jgi:hypothetical protein
MRGPEGRPPNVSPAREGWGILARVALGAKSGDLLLSFPTPNSSMKIGTKGTALVVPR